MDDQMAQMVRQALALNVRLGRADAIGQDDVAQVGRGVLGRGDGVVGVAVVGRVLVRDAGARVALSSPA